MGTGHTILALSCTVEAIQPGRVVLRHGSEQVAVPSTGTVILLKKGEKVWLRVEART